MSKHAGERGRPSDGGRGREYRWRSWFLRIYGWNCGFFFTPAVRSHKVYVRWVVRPHDPSLGFLLGRNEDGEWGLDIAFGPLLRIESALPEYVALAASTGADQ